MIKDPNDNLIFLSYDQSLKKIESSNLLSRNRKKIIKIYNSFDGITFFIPDMESYSRFPLIWENLPKVELTLKQIAEKFELKEEQVIISDLY